MNQEIKHANLNPDFDSTGFLGFLIKWKKPLLIVSISAIVISSIVSLIIKDKYLSTVIFFPAYTSSISKSVMTLDAAGRNDIVAFGEEEQAEQMLQILNSDEIKWFVIGKYDLMKHYRIDPNDKYKLTKLIEEYESNVKFKRTEFQSIRIDVLDESPDTAAMMANDIATKVDEVKNRMQRERAAEALKVIEAEYFKMEKYMHNVDDSLTKMREKGVHEYEKQIEMLSAEYYKAIASGNASAVNKLQEKLDTLAKYGSAFIALNINAEFERDRLILLRSKYEETMVDATQNIPHKFIVNNAFPSEKKAYPVRWLIVVISTLSAFLLCVISIIVVENYRRVVDAGLQKA
jgi:uncharacterized protein involved in exopolysaccharide biosynthesis